PRPPRARGRPRPPDDARVSTGITEQGSTVRRSRLCIGCKAASGEPPIRGIINMFTRRQFLTRTLQGSSLLALGSVVPQFVASTARAAEAGKDNVLVVVEMNGGNDGLNTVIPYADDLYHKARTTLRLTKDQVVKVNDHIGLNPGMRSFGQMLEKGQL